MAQPTSDDAKNAPTLPQWDESIVLEYEARVEPFTGLFVKDLLEPIISKENGVGVPPSLLDVGCGSGCASLLALEAGFQVTATDVSNAMVERTRQRAEEKGLGEIQCLVADGQNLSSYPEITSTPGFDYAIGAFSLIFFPDPAKGLAEIYQCLSDKGGKVLLTAWGSTEETPAFQLFQDAFREILPETSGKGKPKRLSGSQELLQSLLEEAKFQDIKVVGPVSHNVHVASPQAYFDRFALTSPKIKGDLAQLDNTNRELVKAKVMELAKERGGQHDGSVSIPSMAYLAYGTKQI